MFIYKLYTNLDSRRVIVVQYKLKFYIAVTFVIFNAYKDTLYKIYVRVCNLSPYKISYYNEQLIIVIAIKRKENRTSRGFRLPILKKKF